MKRTVSALVIIASFIIFAAAGCSKSSSPAGPGPAAAVDYSAMATVAAGSFTETDGVYAFINSFPAFKIGKYEVTYDLWYTVYHWALARGYAFQNAGTEGSYGITGAAPTAAKNQPVANVNWRDAIVWCNAYSMMSGLLPVYYSNPEFSAIIKDSTGGAYLASLNNAAGSFDNPYVLWSANGYRLPAEGEWKYAASYIDGVSQTPYDFASGASANYSDTTATAAVAWYIGNSSFATRDAGGKKPNALGIYDMSGNVYEWAWDWFYVYPGTSYAYTGPATGSYRLILGGAVSDDISSTAVGYRGFAEPFFQNSDLGFRVARTE